MERNGVNNPVFNTIEPQNCSEIQEDQLQPDLVKQLPLEFLKQQHAIPIVRDGREVVIALADPMNVEAYDAIVSILSAEAPPDDAPWTFEQPCPRLICPVQEIENAISYCYYHAEQTEQLSHIVDDNLEDTLNYLGGQTEDLLNIASQAPAVKLVNTILYQAVQSRASDIHIEPYETETRVRYRIDGVMHDVMSVARDQLAAVQSRLKIMANLNIAEQRLPQDGQSRIKIGEDLVDIRVSVIPTLGGERIVLRLLDKSHGQLHLDEIGFDGQALVTFKQLIQVPHGIILLTGPTGSGKTTTLYGALNELNNQELNILTVEDPIEYQLPGVGQMQVKPKIDLTFANCLRHILRQDPDIIMIGEIRDAETAQIAIQASMTGHLVLSTLHTNDAASAITRLIDMGIEPYLISSSVMAIIAQRLVRIICPECKTVDQEGTAQGLLPPLDQTSALETYTSTLYRGAGCRHCLNTGYRGRTGIFELLVVDDALRNLITQRSATHQVREQATRNGMITLRQDGLQKAYAGHTTLEEVCRVTQDNLIESSGG
ncbi:GspE/PulE family protein [Planctomycetota bacterium]